MHELRNNSALKLAVDNVRYVLTVRRKERERLKLKYEIAAFCFQRRLNVWHKANFNPDQPRVPAGNADGGQWTTNVYASGRFTDISAQRRRVAIDYSNALTGMSTVDDTTRSLSKTLAAVIDSMPSGSGPLYGIAVHVAFANIVRFQGLRGIGLSDVETTFNLLPDSYYGSKESIRTDVILRDDIGDIIAIYDVKTGGATIRPQRAAEIRAKTKTGNNIPIIELNVSRGVMLKYHQLVELRTAFPFPVHRS